MAEAGWMGVSELAIHRGVSKQAISKRVAALEARGAIKTRQGTGGVKLVHVAQFAKAVEETGDPSYELTGRGSKRGQVPDYVYAEEQARKTAIQADLAQLELEERLGYLLPRAEVEAAMVRCGEVMVRVIEQLQTNVDDWASAVAKNGVHGLRLAVKAEQRRLRERIAQEMRLLADAPAVAAKE
jgi:DNA-binding MarR family transcriptional regulator